MHAQMPSFTDQTNAAGVTFTQGDLGGVLRNAGYDAAHLGASDRYMAAIERFVREHPEDYLWMHRRWKTRPRFEEEGKPMPASLKEKLRDLPWVDDALIAKLENAST